MPFTYSLRVDPPSLVILHGHGRVDSTMWLKALRAMLLDGRFVIGMPILVDVSETDDVPGNRESIVIVRHCLQLIPRSRAAVLTRRPCLYGFTRDGDKRANDRVRAFKALTDAIEWLDVACADNSVSWQQRL